jgi:hypothetical protein
MTHIKETLWSISPRKNSPMTIIVRLEPGSGQAETRVEQLVVTTLAATGAMPLNTLAERVAAELYREELRNGAQTLDIGLFGSRLFLSDVINEIKARNGTLWQIENVKDA